MQYHASNLREQNHPDQDKFPKEFPLNGVRGGGKLQKYLSQNSIERHKAQYENMLFLCKRPANPIFSRGQEHGMIYWNITKEIMHGKAGWSG